MEDQNFILEFLEIYRSLPALWNVKSKEYSDRNAKNVAYEKLLIKYKEKHPDATRKDLCKKICNLRSAYKRESKRISSLEKSGAGYTEENESSLFYFDAMSFLYDSEQPAPSRNSFTSYNESESEEIEQPAKKKKKNSSDDIISAAAKRLMQPENEFGKLAEAWANELEKMDEMQGVFAVKFINEILFEGRMGTLNRNSVQINVSNSANRTQNNAFNYANIGANFQRSYCAAPTPITSPTNTTYSIEYNRASTPMPIPSPQNLHNMYTETLCSSNSTQALTLPNVTADIRTEEVPNVAGRYFAYFQ